MPEITFHTKPYRHYRINADPADPMHKWTADEPYGCVASVTQVLGVLDKSGPLMGWATNITYAGCARVTQTYGAPPSTFMLKDAVRRYSLDHNSVRDDAALRGTEVHKIGEDWVTDGRLPSFADYHESRHGYIRAMAKFLRVHGDGLALAEQITGSVKHGFAGTCDTVATATFGDGQRVRLDYKTSKQVYARSHFRQLGAYELAAVEGGDDPSDRLGIVILRPDGEFTIHYADEVVWRTTPADSFLRVLDVFRDEDPLKRHEDATYRARVKRERAAE